MWYEVHVTVEEQPTLTQTIDFEKVCREEFNCKCNLIELSSGKYPLQLMLAAKAAHKDDEQAAVWGMIFAKRLTDKGWNVVRTKVESELKKGTNAYFEAHWKFHLDGQQRFMEFNHFISVFNSPLEDADPATWPKYMSSRNHLQEGVYYLSQRNYSGDYNAAKKQFDKASKQIEQYNLPLDKAHYERVLCDSFPGLDEGWTD